MSKPMYLCLPFMSGSCRNASCINYHPLDTAQFQVAKQEIAKKASAEIQMSKICINFNNGTCKFNPCKFLHIKNHFHLLGQTEPQTINIDIIIGELSTAMKALQQKIYTIEYAGLSVHKELTQLREKYMVVIRSLIDNINSNCSKINA